MSSFKSLLSVHLESNHLSGPIHKGYLELPNLHILDLSSNRLTGSVPDLLLSSQLQILNLENNMFITLPTSIGKLSHLEILIIGSNQLKGIISEAHMSNLSRLHRINLSFNQLLSVKPNLHWLPPFQLRSLQLSHCKLGPSFPLWLKTQTTIQSLDISNSEISDVVPSWFGRIWLQLYYLNASHNQMHGILSTFFNVSYGPLQEMDLVLDLSSNNISGPITFLCNGTFELLDLSNNLLSGQIPNCVASIESLFYLDLATNTFTGEIPFLCNSTSQLVDLSINQLFGQIPNCFQNTGMYMEWLKYLNLASNRISGEIPLSFGNLTMLSSLQLEDNMFTGVLPISMRHCYQLEIIDVGENKLAGNVPSWLGDLLGLKVLVLRSNEFIGSISSKICDLRNLLILDLSLNNLSGAIPKCVDNFTVMAKKGRQYVAAGPISSMVAEPPGSEHGIEQGIDSFENAYLMWKGQEVKYANHLDLVIMIDLSSNNLTGEIPFNITKLIGLVALNLSRNNLVGPIPRDIGLLKSLDSLDLSRNHLSGTIPTNLGELGYLGVLDLSYNNLSGKIPPGPKLTTFGDAYVGNSGLCGFPLNKPCPGDPQSNNYDHRTTSNGKDEDEYMLIDGGFYIALAVGFIVGFWGSSGTIFVSRTARHKLFSVVEFVCLRMELLKACIQKLL